MLNFVFTVVVAAGLCLLVLLGLMALTRRRINKQIVCPMDGRPRDVELVGRSVDPDHWDDVVSCGRPGEQPLKGHHIACSKECLNEPENAPSKDLRRRK